MKKIFLQNNPPLNSWPYAGEIISSLTTRMGFPPLVIEPYKVIR
ncbi:MAG: protein-export chaperone SecB [Firmicutes bacterium]|nr:protein-export chaperone SecB [Bacillota bacterium]